MKTKSTSQFSYSSSPAVVLTVAGSDNSSGAGIQADLKTFSSLGVYGLTTVTCVVAEIPGRVEGILPVSVDLLRQQILLSATTYPIVGMKTGMLYSPELVTVVGNCLKEWPGNQPLLVVDPVMIASSGDSLILDETILVYEKALFPWASLVTPNLDETRALLKACRTSTNSIEDWDLISLDSMRDAGRVLSEHFGVPFLIKGGHLVVDSNRATDFLCRPGGEVEEFSSKRIPGSSKHGTGCTYSAAITAELARGNSLSESVRRAKEYVTSAIQESLRWRRRPEDGSEVEALNHFFDRSHG